MKIITYQVEKGGVGKTCLAVHHAWYLKQLGFKVLFVDLDPQASSSDILTREGAKPEWRANAIGMTLNLFFDTFEYPIHLKSNFDIFRSDHGLNEAGGNDINFFLVSLDKIEEHYDYLVIDTPPAVGTPMLAALAATDYLICPLELSEMGLSGIEFILSKQRDINAQRPKPIEFLGCLVSRWNRHHPEQNAAMTFLLEDDNLSKHIMRGYIVNRQGYATALEKSEPVWAITNNSSSATAGKEICGVFNTIQERIKL